MNKLVDFFRTIRYLIYPPFRREVDRDYGWAMNYRALRHLTPSYDRADMDACWILLGKMKELV